MWTTVAVLAALSLAPQQTNPLTLANVRSTYGSLGVPRKENRLLPGDQVFVAFDIQGITVDPQGRVLYSTTTEVHDKSGKRLFMQEPRDQEAQNALGGKSVPGFVMLNVGLDSPAGEYTVKVTVTDRATKGSQSFSRTFEVLPKAFGLVRLTTSADPEGQIPQSVFQSGAGLWVHGGLVGFERSKSNGLPHVAVELQVLDDKGQPTMAKPFAGTIKEEASASAQFMPVRFLVSLNRPGKFTVQLKATDQLSKKSAELSFPLTVVAAP